MLIIMLSLSMFIGSLTMDQATNFHTEEMYVSQCEEISSDNYLITMSDFVGFDYEFYAYDAYELDIIHEVLMYDIPNAPDDSDSISDDMLINIY